MNDRPQHPAGKKLYLELLRIFAIVLVIYNHCALQLEPPAELGCTGIAGFLDACRTLVCINVPCFFMITGALLLHRTGEPSGKQAWRIVRIVVVLLLFWLLQYGFEVCTTDARFGVRTYLRLICEGGLYDIAPAASWFFYGYLLLLLFMPLIRPMVQGMGNTCFLYLFALQLAIGAVLPGFMEAAGLHSTIPVLQPFVRMPFSLAYGMYYLVLGYFLEHRLPAMAFPRAAKVSFACITVVCTALAAKTGNPQWLPPLAAAAYLGARKLAASVACLQLPMARSVIVACGGAVFFVMMTENIFRCLFAGLCLHPLPLAVEWGISAYWITWVGILAVWACATLLGILLRCIPWLRRLL